MKKKMFYVGNNVEFYTTDFGAEPYLISVHDNVVCAANVRFINHDVSCYRIAHYLEIDKNQVDKVGSIELFDNCFVGAYTLLMPGCSVGENSIIAAGSIVTKHIPANEVWGGIPAKDIMNIDEYAKRVVEESKSYPWMNKKCNSNEEFIKMRQDFFFNR